MYIILLAVDDDVFLCSFSVQQCGDVFDKRFNTAFLNAAVQETNAQYGGFGLKVTQVVFVNGAVDPWHALGMISDLNPESPAIFIKGKTCLSVYTVKMCSLTYSNSLLT